MSDAKVQLDLLRGSGDLMTSILPLSISQSIPHLDNSPARNAELRQTRETQRSRQSVFERDESEVRYHDDDRRSAERRRRTRADDDQNQRSQSDADSSAEQARQFGQVLVDHLAENPDTALQNGLNLEAQRSANPVSQAPAKTPLQLSATRALPAGTSETATNDQLKANRTVKQPANTPSAWAETSQQKNTNDDSQKNAALDRVLLLQQQSAGTSQRTEDSKNRTARIVSDRTILNGANSFASTRIKADSEANTAPQPATLQNSEVQQILSDLDNGVLPFTIEEFQLNPADEALIESRDLLQEQALQKSIRSTLLSHEEASKAGEQAISLIADARSASWPASDIPIVSASQAELIFQSTDSRLLSADEEGALSSAAASTSLGDVSGNPETSMTTIKAMEARSDDSGNASDSGQRLAGAETVKGSSATTNTGSTAAVTSFAELVSSEVRQPLSSQVSQAVYEHLQKHGGTDKPALTMRLDPPELGELVISMKQTKEGMSIRVTAREPVTMDMLLARGEEIQQQLKESNADIVELQFTESGDNGSSRQDSSQRQDREDQVAGRMSAFGRRAVAVAEQADAATSVSAPLVSSGTLSFRA